MTCRDGIICSRTIDSSNVPRVACGNQIATGGVSEGHRPTHTCRSLSTSKSNVMEDTRCSTVAEKHAIAILKKGHDAVKALFDAFEKAEPPAAKEKIIDQAVAALKMHAVLEEEIFYPTVRAHVGNKLINEADQEHHGAKVLIAELDPGGRKNDHRV